LIDNYSDIYYYFVGLLVVVHVVVMRWSQRCHGYGRYGDEDATCLCRWWHAHWLSALTLCGPVLTVTWCGTTSGDHEWTWRHIDSESNNRHWSIFS